MKLKTLVSTLASVLLIGSQAAYADKWGDQFPHIAATGDIPGMCSYEEMSKKDYSGRTLTINTHAIPVMGEPTALHAEQFEKLTVETPSWEGRVQMADDPEQARKDFIWESTGKPPFCF